MTVFRRWDIVKISYTANPAMAPTHRPGLVIVAGELFRDHGLLWVLMITSATNRGWAGDIDIKDVTTAGLGVPSIIRTAKIMTVQGRDAYVIGSLASSQRQAVGERVFGAMGLIEAA
ncbi:MAG: type II toxin-antitoxin system PemK/MazF family toxin [Acidocella sp.]|nr:type II toxin-antitoxin system PemK/MazF family toxin [Acidocella sp.]